MTTRLRISALLILSLSVTPVFAGEKTGGPQGQGTPDAPPTVSTGPSTVLDDIQKGWSIGNEELILRHFGSNKVSIVIDGSVSGSYSKDQGYYFFKDLFKSTITRKFVFVQVRNSNDEGTASFAIAERRYTRRDDGRPVKDKVYVALHLERGGDTGQWVLDEIKSIR